MKHLLIIFTLLLTSISWSKDVDIKDLVEREGLFYKKFSNKLFNGKVRGLVQGKIKKGQFEGEVLIYHENGQLEYKQNYKNGKYEGEWLSYFDDGRLKEKSNYKDGQLHGEYTLYWYNGNIMKIGNYKDGKEQGEWLDYSEEGVIAMKTKFKNGLREGETFLYRDGQIAEVWFFEEGKWISRKPY